MTPAQLGGVSVAFVCQVHALQELLGFGADFSGIAMLNFDWGVGEVTHDVPVWEQVEILEHQSVVMPEPFFITARGFFPVFHGQSGFSEVFDAPGIHVVQESGTAQQGGLP